MVDAGRARWCAVAMPVPRVREETTEPTVGVPSAQVRDFHGVPFETFREAGHHSRRRAPSGDERVVQRGDDDFAADRGADDGRGYPGEDPGATEIRGRDRRPPAPSGRGGLDALLRGAAQKAEVRAFAAAAPPAGAAPRRAVKRRRVPAPSASGAGETVSATAVRIRRAGREGRPSLRAPPIGLPARHLRALRDAAREASSAAAALGSADGKAAAFRSTSMRYIHAGLELSNDGWRRRSARRSSGCCSPESCCWCSTWPRRALLNSARFAELRQAEHDVLGRIIAARACADAGGSEAEIRKAASEAIEADPSIEPANGAATSANGAAREKEASADEETRETRPDGDEAIPPEPSRTETEQTEQERTEQRTYPGCVPPLKHTHCLRHLALFTKLRPRVHAFLRAASRLCQLYIYTMGDKRYAAEMAHLLDPSGDLFSGASSATRRARTRA